MKTKSYIILLLVGLFFSCHFFKEEKSGTPVARVNESYLYKEDIKNLTSEGMPKEDSTVLVNNYINRWATQQLLMQGALLNLSETKQTEFNKLIEQYKSDLYTQAYLDALVNRDLSSSVTQEEAQEYYNKNLEAFKLKEELVKFRYIYIDEKSNDLSEITEKFKRFNLNDKKELDSISIHFKSYSLNDSIWIKLSQVTDKIPVINSQNKNELLKKSNFIQLQDSLGLYLMQINDVLLPNKSIAPLEYVKPTIEQIVVNRRKLERIRELEKDITKDAIKNKQFEIYK